MKKKIRVLALFTALVLVCLSATGCNAIDEMRKNHAFYTETGSVLLGETEYLPLPLNNFFSPYNPGEINAIQITQADVPVLLSTVVGNSGTLYNDGVILSSDWGEQYYCRADKYQAIAAQLASEFIPTGYCFVYYEFNQDTHMYDEHDLLLTEEQEKAVKEILASVEGNERLINADYRSDYTIDLRTCSDNMLLRKDAVSIEKTKNTYYIIDYINSPNKSGVEYSVPSDYNSLFDGIFQYTIQAEKIEDEYYDDLYGYDKDELDIDYEIV